ncbi:MAG: peptide-methionine (S)-S-oxide reductase MsrA [Verrucomicrobia bacterium]|nr:peptide-methionine (S)-S-oxide reductase MsrA [Verrucomicrobiota bacterium]
MKSKFLKILFVPLFLICSYWSGLSAAAPSKGQTETAIFAGGCFWCVQHDFDTVRGVISTTAGYTGGTKVDPTYEEVSSGGTGHVESVKVVYDPSKVSYAQLLDFYFHNIDPTRRDGQFCDEGSQYRPVIFYENEEQKMLAEKYRQDLVASNKFKTVEVDILPATAFYPAEKYHQEYYQKNPIRYKFYRANCGRDSRLKQLWGSGG